MRYISTLLLLVLINNFLYSQKSGKIIITGTVVDKTDNKPLPFANIALSNSNIGTVTNSKGEFKLVVLSQYKEQNLQISFIGYHTKIVKVSSVQPNSHFYLEENSQLLDEVIVTGLSAKTIIEKALERIPDNYFAKPYTSTGFYRVTSKKDDSYIHLSEAVFEIFNSKSKPSQLKLIKMRAIKDEKASRGIDLGLYAKGVISFDVMNNLDEYGFLSKRGLKNHKFQLEDQSHYFGNDVYVISFDQIDGLKKAGYKGTLYIDRETFAIVHLNFGLSPKDIRYHQFGDAVQRALMKLLDIHIDMHKNEYQIAYKKIGNKYYLSKIGNDAVLSFRSNKRHYNFKEDTRVDYIVTNIELDRNQAFSKADVIGSNKLIEEQDSEYDQAFWDNYNIILPDTDFSAIVHKIEANNKANDTKTEIADLLHKYPKDETARIDSILSYYNRKDLFNGNALISKNGKAIFKKSYNNEATQNKRNTQFRIGSTSKTFTSMLIMLLENDGKLRLSDSIGLYLPNYKYGEITIEQLLTHQSGIPNYLARNDYVVQLFDKAYQPNELVSKFCSDSLEFIPGTKFHYSNSGFVILSSIIEKVTGKPFGEVLKNRIFDPLNMENTYFGSSSDTTNLAVGYMYGQPEPKYFIQNVAGAGGITSTTEDLLKWSNAIDQNRLLPKVKQDLLFVTRAAYTDWDADYGYGWMLDKFMFKASKKHKIVYHPGTDFGFYSMFLKQPDEQITIILLNNTGEFPRFEMTDLILNVLN